MIVNAADLDHHNNINQDDPKPGPSTTAAEFDLEVFDSGSSCSLEDCWRCDKDCPPVNAPVQGLFYVLLDLDTGFEFEIRGKQIIVMVTYIYVEGVRKLFGLAQNFAISKKSTILIQSS